MLSRLPGIAVVALLFACIAWFWCHPVIAAPVKTPKEACEVAKTRVSALWHFPVSQVAFCDPIGEADSPSGYYVLGLHGKRYDCGEVCGSTLMGWFAVQKTTGRVFEWDVADMKLGPPFKAHP